jgi:bifunctional non-homologous end joining protein LigD
LIGLPGIRTHSGNRVHIDYRQNSIGRNTAAPYSLRALPGAPVSTPLSWKEIEDGRIRPSDFTLKTVPARIESLGDLFAPLLK